METDPDLLLLPEPSIDGSESGHGSSPAGVPVFSGDLLELLVSSAIDTVSLQFTLREVDEALNIMVESHFSAGFDFEVEGVIGVGSEVAYVHGRDDLTGVDIIQRLDITYPRGTRVARHAEVAVDAQGGQPAFPDFSYHVIGHNWTTPSQRQRINAPRHTTLMSQDIGEIRSIAPDPHGRFVMVLSQQGVLYRLTNERGGQLLPVSDSAEVPELVHMHNGYPHWHPDLGRVFLFEKQMTESTRILVIDYDNDGVMDTVVPLDVASFDLLGYLDVFLTNGSFDMVFSSYDD
mgnify:CR=1 FL=1